MAVTSSLAQLSESVAPVSLAKENLLPTPGAFRTLFPDLGLRRGSVVSVDSPSLISALAAYVTSKQLWCAIVDFPSLFLASTSFYGGDLDRCVVVNSTNNDLKIMASVLEVFDLVVWSLNSSISVSDSRKLQAIARNKNSSLLICGSRHWKAGFSLELEVTGQEWQGIGNGHGLLCARQIEITSQGRGAANRQTKLRFWFPDDKGEIRVINQQRPRLEVAS